MSVQRDRINQARINAGLTPLPEIMSDYYSDLDRIKEAGYQHTLDHKTPCYCDSAYHPAGH